MLFSECTTTDWRTTGVIDASLKVIDMNNIPKKFELVKSKPSWDSQNKSFLENLVGGQDVLDKIPTVGIISGQTDYLDLVQESDMVDQDRKSVHWTKGIDVFNREFLSFRVSVSKEGEPPEFLIFTLFRRRSTSNLFVFCKSHYSSGSANIFERIMGTGCVVTPGDVDRFIQLFQAGHITRDVVLSNDTVVTCTARLQRV